VVPDVQHAYVWVAAERVEEVASDPIALGAERPPAGAVCLRLDVPHVCLELANVAGQIPQVRQRSVRDGLKVDLQAADATLEVSQGAVEFVERIGDRLAASRSVLAGFGGREVETAGDSFLVVFDTAEGAIRCGLALVGALAAIRLPIRVGVHNGEVATSDDHVRASRCMRRPAS
jgi:hypothetical protein